MPLTFSYPLNGPPPGSGGIGFQDGPFVHPYAGADMRSFLGFGLTQPFRRDLRGDFANDSEAALVASCVAQVIGTQSSGPNSEGEVPWRPEFGSRLHALRHRNLDDATVDNLAKVYVADALRQWEPRYKLRGIGLFKVKSGPLARDVNSLWVRVLGDVIRANVPSNQVIVPSVTVDVELG